MKESLWYAPYKPYLPSLIKDIRRRFRIHNYLTSFLFILAAVGLFIYYQTELLKPFIIPENIYYIYGILVLYTILLVLGLSQIFAYTLLTHELRYEMKRKLIVFESFILLLLGGGLIIFYAPIGYGFKENKKRRYLRRFAKKLPKPTRVQSAVLLVNDPHLAHEHYYLAHKYIRGDVGYNKDIFEGIKHLKHAASYGHYMATYYLAKVYSRGYENISVPTDLYLAEKYALKALLECKPSGTKRGDLYLVYANIMWQLSDYDKFNKSDTYIVVKDLLLKAHNFGNKDANDKLIALKKAFTRIDETKANVVLSKEPFTYLLKEYEKDLNVVHSAILKTPAMRLRDLTK